MDFLVKLEILLIALKLEILVCLVCVPVLVCWRKKSIVAIETTMDGIGAEGDITDVGEIMCPALRSFEFEDVLCHIFQMPFAILLSGSSAQSRLSSLHDPKCAPINHIYWCNSSLTRQTEQYCNLVPFALLPLVSAACIVTQTVNMKSIM